MAAYPCTLSLNLLFTTGSNCLRCIFLPMSLFYFTGSGEVCLAHGLTQPTNDAISDVRTLKFISDVTYAATRKTPNEVQRRSLFDIKCQKKKEK